jgi:hypothetical protein
MLIAFSPARDATMKTYKQRGYCFKQAQHRQARDDYPLVKPLK